MITFEVNDMTCAHCASTISKAVRSVDQGAEVQVDLSTHQVRIEPKAANAQELSAAIMEAGYTPVSVVEAVRTAAPARAGGCCCGSGSGCRS